MGMLDVTVVLLNDNYASTAIGPIEVFHSAGSLWQELHGDAQNPRFRVTVASLDGRSVTSPYGVRLLPRVAVSAVKTTNLVVVPSSGLDFDDQFQRHAALLPWLRRKAAQGAYIAGTCTGAARRQATQAPRIAKGPARSPRRDSSRTSAFEPWRFCSPFDPACVEFNRLGNGQDKCRLRRSAVTPSQPGLPASRRHRAT